MSTKKIKPQTFNELTSPSSLIKKKEGDKETIKKTENEADPEETKPDPKDAQDSYNQNHKNKKKKKKRPSNNSPGNPHENTPMSQRTRSKTK